MYRAVHIVEIWVWEQLVGAVALDPAMGYYAFEYAPEFLKTGIELAPLTMPTASAQRPFIFPELPEFTFKRLPAMLADSLPDDFGNSLVQAWMANQGVAASDITALDRLAYAGKRSMGALEFRPARGPTARRSTAIDLSELIESARRAMHGELEDEAQTTAALKQLISIGTSAGGARAKAAIAWNSHTNEIRTGQFEVEPGWEHWLLKFDGMTQNAELADSQPYGRIEFAYYLMATQAGINMSPCRLLEEGGRAHFMTRRFDREGNAKLHTQTLCGLAQLDFRARGVHDYSQCLEAMRRLNLGPESFQQMFRRIAFNVMAKNCDNHTKNLSFMLRERGAWELAPAYDLIYAYNPAGEWTYQHLMSVNGKFQQIRREDLLIVADRFQIPAASQLLKEVREVVGQWPDFARQANLQGAVSERISEQLTLL